jgi:alkylhydroperoxidase/carboxymuconolactone decarboxylase family protein YurZ
MTEVAPMTAWDYQPPPPTQSGGRTAQDLPLWALLERVDPATREAFAALLDHTIFCEREIALDLKTRFLVLVGITTSVRDDREGIEWSTQLAMKHGASEREVLEAIALTNFPAGTPAMEYAASVWAQMRAGKTSVTQHGDPARTRPFSAWDRWRRTPAGATG